MQRVNRPPIGLSPNKMQTYAVDSPLDTHFTKVDCEEVGCGAHDNGWATVVDESSDLGKRQAAYIRTECRPTTAKLAPGAQCRARYIESRTEAGWTAFTFPPGQQCFQTHQKRLPREELYLVRQGDWRSYGATRQHDRAEHWVEDMAENQDRLNRLIKKG